MEEPFIVPDYIQDLLVASQRGLRGIADKLSYFLDKQVIITDSLYNVWSSSIEELADSSSTIDVHPILEKIEEETLFRCVLTFGDHHSEGIGQPILFENQKYGIIFVLLENSNEEKFQEYAPLLNYAASLCSLRIRKKMDIKEERLRFKDAFLFDLLYGNFKKRDDIISYGAIWNWDFGVSHTILVFSIIDYDFYSTDKQLIQTLSHIIEKCLFQNGIEPISLTKQNEVIVILPNIQRNESPRYTKEFITSIFKQIKKTQLDGRVGCGVGKMYEGPENLFLSYQEAKVAYELGLLLNIDIPFFENLGLERILYKHDLSDLREFYDYVLGDLHRYDEQNGGELMTTIEDFAKYQFDLKIASESMFVHRNTLRYRLKKIEEVLNIKLDDINNRLNITAALKIKQLHKNLEHSY